MQTSFIGVLHPVAPPIGTTSDAATYDSSSDPFHLSASSTSCSHICFIQWHLQPVAPTSVSSSGHVSVYTKQENGDDTSGQFPAWEMSNCVAAELFPCMAVSLQDIAADAQSNTLVQTFITGAGDPAVAQDVALVHTSITGAGIAAEAQSNTFVQPSGQVSA